MSSRTFTSC